MGNWWLVTSSWLCACSCTMSWAKFFGETSNHPGDSVPLQPRFGALWLLAFPKTKISFESEEVSDPQWDSGEYDGAADGDWENCVRSQGAYFEGDWGIIVLCTVFLVSCTFFSKYLYSYYMAEYFLGRPRCISLQFFSAIFCCYCINLVYLVKFTHRLFHILEIVFLKFHCLFYVYFIVYFTVCFM